MTETLKELSNVTLPTSNPLTDSFGLGRLWGGTGWHPESEYSPVHTGVDFSARPSSDVRMAMKGKIWGDFVPGMVGSYCMMLPETSEEFAAYFFHCEPTAPIWVAKNKDDVVTHMAGYGIGAPHLHFELAITNKVGHYLMSNKILRKFDWRAFAAMKAQKAGFNVDVVLQRIQKQMQERGILDIGENYVLVYGLPAYRKSTNSHVGNGMTFLVDPFTVIDKEM